MIRIGITGIIGSGKSTIAQIFAILGIPVYNADKEAKRLMQHNSEIKTNLIQEFGESIYNAGIPDKKVLSALVFNNAKNREKINSIIHPIVISDFQSWSEQKNKENIKIVAIESALLFQTKINTIVNYTINIYSDDDTLISRIITRDGSTHSEAIKKINIQRSQIPADAKADFNIYNDEKNSLILQSIDVINYVKLKLN